jgi:hypothetical protein
MFPTQITGNGNSTEERIPVSYKKFLMEVIRPYRSEMGYRNIFFICIIFIKSAWSA